MAEHVFNTLLKMRNDLDRDQEIDWSALAEKIMLDEWTEDLGPQSFERLLQIVASEDPCAYRSWLDLNFWSAQVTWFVLDKPEDRAGWLEKRMEVFGV